MRISSAVIVRHSCGPSNCRGQAFGRNTRMHEGSSPGWAETGRPSRLAVPRVRLSAEALAAIRSLLDIKSVLPGSKISPGCARLGMNGRPNGIAMPSIAL